MRAAASLWSAAVMLKVRYVATPRAVTRRPHVWTEVVDGVRALGSSRDLRLLVGLGAAQTFTRGTLSVFTVVVAIDLLGTGEAGVGALTAAIGATHSASLNPISPIDSSASPTRVAISTIAATRSPA